MRLILAALALAGSLAAWAGRYDEYGGASGGPLGNLVAGIIVIGLVLWWVVAVIDPKTRRGTLTVTFGFVGMMFMLVVPAALAMKWWGKEWSLIALAVSGALVMWFLVSQQRKDRRRAARTPSATPSP